MARLTVVPPICETYLPPYGARPGMTPRTECGARAKAVGMHPNWNGMVSVEWCCMNARHDQHRPQKKDLLWENRRGI